jgi:hypothetical protein
MMETHVDEIANNIFRLSNLYAGCTTQWIHIQSIPH